MRKIFFLLVLLFCIGSVSAQTIKEMVFFGDSLTDNGNLYRATYKIMPKSPPYYLGRFSNGPVWAEILGDYYKAKFDINYSIYAIGGATTTPRRVRDGALPYHLKKEIDKYLSETDFPQRSKTLFFMWIGGNDYMTEKKQSSDALVTEVVNEITSQIRTLITNGGRNFILIDLPDFSKVPFASKLDQSEKDRLHGVSELNHKKMVEAATQLQKEYPNFKFVFIDAYSIFNDILLNVDFYNKKYGSHITNTQSSCWVGGYSLANENKDVIKSDLQSDELVGYVLNAPDLLASYKVMQAQSLGGMPCADPDDYMFWDTVHPTSAVHQVLSQLMAEKIEAEIRF